MFRPRRLLTTEIRTANGVRITEGEAFEMVICDHNVQGLVGGIVCPAREEGLIRSEQSGYPDVNGASIDTSLRPGMFQGCHCFMLHSA